MTDADNILIQSPPVTLFDEEASAMSEALFRKLDDDTNGYLSQRELLHARNVMTIGNDLGLKHGGLLSDTILHLLHDADSDHDHWVDLREWLSFARSLFEILGRRLFMEKVSYWTSSIQRREPEHTKSAKKHHHHKGLDPPENTRRRAEHYNELRAHSEDTALRGTRISSTCTEVVDDADAGYKPDRRGRLSLLIHTPDGRDRQHSLIGCYGLGFRSKRFSSNSRSRPHSPATPLRVQSPAREGIENMTHATESIVTDNIVIPVPPVQRARSERLSRSRRHSFRRHTSDQGDSQSPSLPTGGHARSGRRPIRTQILNRPNPPISPDMVFDILSRAERGCGIDVDAIMDSFEICRKSGLDMKLQTILPLSSDSDVIPEDLSRGEVGHLCMMLVEDTNLTETDARARIDVVREQCRSFGKLEINGMLQAFYGRKTSGTTISVGVFSKLITLISRLMHIDKTCILLCMLWCELDWFELSDTLVIMLLEKCSSMNLYLSHHRVSVSNSDADADALWRSLSKASLSKAEAIGSKCSSDETQRGYCHFDVANLRYSLHDWARFIHNCGILFRKEGGFTNVYAHAIHRAYVEPRTRPTQRVEKAAEPVRSHIAEDLRPLEGKWEFERLIEELWKQEFMQKDYRSPLAMVTALILKAKESPELMKPIDMNY